MDFLNSETEKQHYREHSQSLTCLIHNEAYVVSLPHDAMHPRYQPWACVRLCLSVSVLLSQAGVLLKRQNVGSHKQHHRIPQGLQFSDAKDLCEIRPGSPPTGAPNAGGVGQTNVGDFRQITGYISKTVKDRHIVSIKIEQEVLCALSNGDIAVDFQCPLTTPNHPIFCISYRHSQLRNG